LIVFAGRDRLSGSRVGLWCLTSLNRPRVVITGLDPVIYSLREADLADGKFGDGRIKSGPPIRWSADTRSLRKGVDAGRFSSRQEFLDAALTFPA
jgi:hypothetical protein